MKLIGKILHYHLTPKNHRGRSGFYSGRIIRVDRLKRSGVIRSIIIQRPLYDGQNDSFNWKGTKIRLVPMDWCKGGVLYRGKVIPINGKGEFQ